MFCYEFDLPLFHHFGRLVLPKALATYLSQVSKLNLSSYMCKNVKNILETQNRNFKELKTFGSFAIGLGRMETFFSLSSILFALLVLKNNDYNVGAFRFGIVALVCSTFVEEQITSHAEQKWRSCHILETELYPSDEFLQWEI